MNSPIPRFRVLAMVALGAATCALSFPLRADPPTYRIFDLGVLTGDNQSRALGLNDEGAVVGTSDSDAFFWLFSPMYGYTGSFTITQLATAAAGNDINNAGIAVGRKAVSGDDIAHRWTLAGGTVTPASLGTLSMMGGEDSEAFAINDASDAVIVGVSYIETAGLPCGRRPAGFRYVLDTSPSMDLLGALGEQYDARAIGVNNNSPALAVGYRQDIDECTFTTFGGCTGEDESLDSHAWSGTTADGFLDVLEDTYSNMRHEAHDVNDQEQSVGYGSMDVNPGPSFACGRRATFWADPDVAPEVLAADVSDQEAHANAITNLDACDMLRVVGQNSTDGTALLWENDGTTWTTTLLKNQLLNECEWGKLIEAHDINEKAWIVGYADRFSGDPLQERAILLLPMVESCYADLDGDCKVDGFDLAILLRDWEESYCADYTCMGDLACDGEDDGVVDGIDLALLLGAWTGINLCSEDCIQGWGVCDGGGESAQSSSEDGGTNPTLIAELIEQLIGLGEIEAAAQLAELTDD